MAAVGGSPLECVWCDLLLIELSFKAFLMLGSLCVGHWTWCVSSRTHFVERSLSEQPRRANWCDCCHRASLQPHSVNLWTDACCRSLVVSWLRAGVGAGCIWRELFLLAGECLRNTAYAFAWDTASLYEFFSLRKWGQHQPERWEQSAVILKWIFLLSAFLQRYSEVILGGKRHSEGKRTDINTNFSFAFGILVVGHCLIFWTVFERGRRQKAVCVDLEGKMSVRCLKGRAEKPVSAIAKRTLRLAQLHGDEPRETLHSRSPSARKPLGLVLFSRRYQIAGTCCHSRYGGRNKWCLGTFNSDF